LHLIINYFNNNKKLPENVDSSEQFEWYKPTGYNKSDDITHEYFNKRIEDTFIINYNSNINYNQLYQFINYKKINIHLLIPFLIKYFSPSIEIKTIISNIETKYNLNFQYNNLCVLFHRGNDKSTETKLCSHEEIIAMAKSCLERNPNIVFLIQSDETDFIEKAFKEFPNSIIFRDEIRHIPQNNNNTVDKLIKEDNHKFSKYFLAITIIMSKCKYIICGSGNCSIWIMFYRGHTNNVLQYLNGKWL
jgi:hypothetical protein